MSPTQRSLKLLRDEGWTVAIVEKYNSFVKRRFDLWNFGDLLAFRGDEVVIVQTTSGPHVAERVAKIRMIPTADFWLQSYNRLIEVHGWRRVGPKGKRKVWECRRINVKRISNVSEALAAVGL